MLQADDAQDGAGEVRCWRFTKFSACSSRKVNEIQSLGLPSRGSLPSLVVAGLFRGKSLLLVDSLAGKRGDLLEGRGEGSDGNCEGARLRDHYRGLGVGVQPISRS